MSKRHNILLSTALAIGLALPVSAQQSSDPDAVVATVNGIEITLGHMILARQALPTQFQELPDEVLYNGVIENLIQQTILSQSIGNEISKRDAMVIENQSREILAGSIIDRVVEGATTQDAVEAAYNERFADAEPSREYNASHILVETEDEAKIIVAELAEGADFATLAKEKSTGPSGPNGGDLSWFGPGMMVAPFEEVVVTLEKEAVSGPVQTQFGWHVIKLNDTRLTDAPTLEQVRGEIEEELQRKAVEDLIQELTAGADIIRAEAGTIDPSALSMPELVQ